MSATLCIMALFVAELPIALTPEQAQLEALQAERAADAKLMRGFAWGSVVVAGLGTGAAIATGMIEREQRRSFQNDIAGYNNSTQRTPTEFAALMAREKTMGAYTASTVLFSVIAAGAATAAISLFVLSRPSTRLDVGVGLGGATLTYAF